MIRAIERETREKKTRSRRQARPSSASSPPTCAMRSKRPRFCASSTRRGTKSGAQPWRRCGRQLACGATKRPVASLYDVRSPECSIGALSGSQTQICVPGDRSRSTWPRAARRRARGARGRAGFVVVARAALSAQSHAAVRGRRPNSRRRRRRRRLHRRHRRRGRATASPNEQKQSDSSCRATNPNTPHPTSPTPRSVPPVPYAVTKMSSVRSPSASRISGPGGRKGDDATLRKYGAWGAVEGDDATFFVHRLPVVSMARGCERLYERVPRRPPRHSTTGRPLIDMARGGWSHQRMPQRPPRHELM